MILPGRDIGEAQVDTDSEQQNNYALQFMTKKAKPRRVGRAKQIPVSRRVDVTREEFNRVIAILNERGEIINGLRHNQDVQFQRLAQLQAELDLLRRAFDKSRGQ